MTPRHPTSVAVILVNWNGPADTAECLESLRRVEHSPMTVVVVDNGSTDDSVARLTGQYPEAVVLTAGENLGFAGGNNRGIRWALDQGFAFICLLNNDTIVEPDFLAVLTRTALEHPEYPLLSPAIYYYHQRQVPWFAGSYLDLGKAIAIHVPQPAPAAVSEVPWVSGCCMFWAAPRLAALGGFDDRFFLNWEDVDLCVRLQEAGGRAALVADARIYHKVGATLQRAGTSSYYWYRSRLLFARKHCASTYRAVLCATLVDALREAARQARRGRYCAALRLLNSHWWAFVDHFRSRYGRRVGAPRTGHRRP